jgi:hypothetical protein
MTRHMAVLPGCSTLARRVSQLRADNSLKDAPRPDDYVGRCETETVSTSCTLNVPSGPIHGFGIGLTQSKQ